MKLYATTTSERASKGQGGEWLDINIYNEKKEIIAKFEVRESQYPHTEFDILYWKHTPSVSFGEMAYDGNKKIDCGCRKDEFCCFKHFKESKQKDDKCVSCNKLPDQFGRCRCCNDDAF